MFPAIRCLAAVMLMAGACAGQHALAHDEKPQYGGVLQSVKDIAYELAPHERGLMLYVEDHGNPVAMTGVVGKLVLLKGDQRAEVPLKPDGVNRMLAAGVQLATGQRATAVLNMPSGRPVVIQFPAR